MLVIGLGVSGNAAAGYVLSTGRREVVVVDDNTGDLIEARARDLRAEGAKVELGLGAGTGGTSDPDATSALVDRLLDSVDLVVVSPGVAPQHPLLKAARDQDIAAWSEIELGYRAAQASVVAVTGTNGKSTVCTWVGDALGAAGIEHVVCGNIGTPMISVAQDVGPAGVLVVEASSFQLTLTDAFQARAATVLNIGADHLDWHDDADDYARSKARIWRNQTEDDLALANADDDLTVSLARPAHGRHCLFSGTRAVERGVGVREGALWASAMRGEGGFPVIELSRLPDAAPHDIANAAATSALALDCGVPPEAVARTLASPRRLSHRRETVAEIGGVRFVDDSKATNPHAALAAIRSFDDVVLIAGGHNKGLDLGVLADASGHLRGVVGIGEAATEVVAAFESSGLGAETAADMDSAVEVAAKLAAGSGIVLLSPACASFDAYRDYAARGDDFARAVHALENASGDS